MNRIFSNRFLVGFCEIITVVFFIFLLLLGLTRFTYSDTWQIPRETEYQSRNEKYLFRESPTFGKLPVKEFEYGSCRGELYLKEGEKLISQWRRSLVNNVAPLTIVVSDSGKSIVSIGEWGDLNLFPVVFYGRQGELLNAYAKLDQLAPKASLGGTAWLVHSLLFYGPNDDHFIIRFSTGEILLFETETGNLLDEKWKHRYSYWKERSLKGEFTLTDSMKKYEQIQDKLDQLVLHEALQLASSQKSNDAITGEYVLKQYQDKDSIRILQEATKDSTVRIVKRAGKKIREYPIRKAAMKSLELLGEKVNENMILEEVIE